MDKFIVVNDGSGYGVAPAENGASYAYALHVAYQFNRAKRLGERFPQVELEQVIQPPSPPKPAGDGGNRVPLVPVPPAPPSPILLVAPAEPVWAPIQQADIAF